MNVRRKIFQEDQAVHSSRSGSEVKDRKRRAKDGTPKRLRTSDAE